MKAFHSYAIIAVGIVLLLYRDRIADKLILGRSGWIDAMFGGLNRLSNNRRDEYARKLCLIIGIILIVGGIVSLF